MDDAPTALIARDKSDAEGITDPRSGGYPLITIGLVAHNPGAWFEEVLGSLLAQDYPSLELVVIDAASDTPVAPRVHAIVPEATVIPLIANQGFAKNANVLLDQPTLGSYVLICHDDVALAPDCIRRLIEEAMRSNAGVVGPKLLDWNDSNRILHVGLGADKTGRVSELAEPGEYDQEQHDAVRDVFAVPGAVTLVRTDLFRALAGFDEAMVVQGEDLDLCWRAHVFGARVLVNPEATARHREDLGTRIANLERTRYERRHRIRAMLSNYGFLHTVRVLPQALAASLVNIVIALSQGRVGEVFDILGAWGWNLRRLPSILGRRRALRRGRQIDDVDVRALQTPGFEGLQAWRRRRADRRSEADALASAAEAMAAAQERRKWMQLTVAVWTGVIAVVLFGSRGLITDQVPIINEFVAFPEGPAPLLGEWTSTWRSTGIGVEAPSSLLHFVFGVGGIVVFGQMGLLRLLVTLGLILVGAIGVYRLLQPFNARGAQLIALLVYVAAPLPYNSLVAGSWSGLAVYAGLPWICRRLAIAAGIPPFGGEASRWRRGADTIFAGVLLALTALIEPLVGLLVVVVVLGWILGGLATSRPRGLGRLLITAPLALGVAFALLLPASAGVFSRGAVWSIFGGTANVGEANVSLAQLIRMATGPHGNSVLGWALVVVPALAMILAFGLRLDWAARSWFIIVGSWALAWASQQSWMPFPLADVHVLLAPAALFMAVAAGMTSAALTSDLQRYGFGWRQFVPLAAAFALVVSSSAGVGASLDGRWEVVDDGYESVFDFFKDRSPAHARTLWIGDAAVLPVDGWQYDDDLTYSITQARQPTVLDSFGNPDVESIRIRRLFEETMRGSSSRLGERLAVYGIRYVAVVEQNAPAPFGDVTRAVPEQIDARLAEQLDLVRIELRDGATIYENRAYVPMVSAFAPGALIRADEAQSVDIVKSQFALALPDVASLRTYGGLVTPGEMFFGTPSSSRWDLEVNGRSALRSRALDWANAYRIDEPGVAELRHSNHPLYAVASVGQVALWGVVITGLILGRRRRK